MGSCVLSILLFFRPELGVVGFAFLACQQHFRLLFRLLKMTCGLGALVPLLAALVCSIYARPWFSTAPPLPHAVQT
jgi:hypothetical protein